MKYIRPVSTEEVQTAYMPVTNYVDESGFNPDDMRHPRWRHPVVPEPRAAGELEKRLDELGIRWREYEGLDGIRASFDSSLIQVQTLITDYDTKAQRPAWLYVPRWPDKYGEYGAPTAATQYCIRDDGLRLSLDALVSHLMTHRVPE